MEFILIYIVMINLIGVVLMRVDKQRAKRNQWRIQEKTLFGVAVMGGSVGIWTGMRLYRHKTKHSSFVIGIPLIAILQIAFVLYIQNMS
ncbi:membrane protein [Pontibacillus halophilus JSM 076056 = DSM 19796]|uniref:Membrane protein n=1 Tax=Pontibacillus halophilus JSM 076056 = DSM 19796 TaxID=1385510 RepID=A0A0A5GN43_9BACI|nr:DUF1294 domain-containing protein [Pontibacillus halophilus]KGX93404.1 membrane protein [Pontibacillus halophilus JSM 076056 = DSM 19796]